MANNKITISKQILLAAYGQASPEEKKLLGNLFGEDVFNDVTDRIKTFHDAYYELGNDHPCVKSYENYVSTAGVEEKDIIAFLKLRIICSALNEGWEPQFSDGEFRWYPWFILYSANELAAKTDGWRAARTIVSLDNYRVVGRANGNAAGGLVDANAGGASSITITGGGVRLALKTEELANYAARQFAELWADFYLIRAK